MLTLALHALHGFAALMGVFGPASVVTSFLTGWPSILAVIVNYVIKRGKGRGTDLQSHFAWQIRTFWWALAWALAAGLLILTVVAIPLAGLLAVLVGLWVLYRIARGWIRLANGQSAPLPLRLAL